MWAELGRHWKLVALRGVAALVFGVLTLLSPALALTVLVLFWGAYALVDGVFALVAAFSMRSAGQFNWPLALVGVIGVAAGLVAFFWPQLTAIGLLLIIAGWALAMGIFQIVAAIRLRKSIRNEWWMILSGAISVLFGVLMIANPGAGALAVVWVIGAYAVFFGVLLVMLALRLRKTSTLKA
nr:HdeD family acid-resistance protein [Pseudomonas aeruginosa]